MVQSQRPSESLVNKSDPLCQKLLLDLKIRVQYQFDVFWQPAIMSLSKNKLSKIVHLGIQYDWSS